MKNPQTSTSEKNRFFDDDELPDGWVLKSFMDVFDIEGGTQPPKSTFVYEPQPNYVRLLQIRDFGERPHPTYISDEKKLKKCVETDILVGRYGASVGRICTGMKGAYNVALTKVIIPNEVDRRFVFFLLQSNFFQEPILEIERSAQNGFNKGDLESIYLPIPPLAEQQRIVARVEVLLTNVNAAHDRLSRVPLIMKKFRQAVLAAACSGRLTEGWREENPYFIHEHCEKVDVEIPDDWDIPEEWQWTTINGMCEKVVDCPHSTPKWTQSGPICIRTSEIKSCYLDLSHARYVSDDTYRERIQRLEPKEGDIVYSREGTLGQAAIIPKGVKICLGQRIMLLRAGSQCSPFFLVYIINSPQILKIVNGFTTGSTSPHINVGDVKKFPVPLPPLAEQYEIVRRVNALFERAEQSEREVAAAMKRTEALTEAVLGRAFRGELVPAGMAEGQV